MGNVRLLSRQLRISPANTVRTSRPSTLRVFMAHFVSLLPSWAADAAAAF